jgi:hypothetical protein
MDYSSASQEIFSDIGAPLKAWCRNCDRSFSLAELSEKLPGCIKGERHQLVPIYVGHNPEDEEMRSDSDYGEGD